MFRDRIKERIRIHSSKLTPNPRNWRLHGDGHRKALREVLSDVGIAGSLLAYHSERNDGALTLIDGHLRAEEIDQDVHVDVLDVNDAEADELLATFDPLASMAGTDGARLAELVANVKGAGATCDELLEQLKEQAATAEFEATKNGEPAEDPGPQIDKAAELQEKWKTELGQTWEIGRHRLVCGDCTDEEVVEKCLDGAVPNLMVTDPPYGVRFDPKWRDNLGGTRRNDYMKPESDTELKFGKSWNRFWGNVAYVWHGDKQRIHLQSALEESGLVFRQEIIWAKPVWPFGRSHYAIRHESCLYMVRDGQAAAWLNEKGDTPTYATTVWELRPVGAAFGRTDKDEEATIHAAQKPLECMARPIRNHEGDVYDPFLGSGTTMVAAEQLGRTCYGIEVEPKYVAVALEWMAGMDLEPKLAG